MRKQTRTVKKLGEEVSLFEVVRLFSKRDLQKIMLVICVQIFLGVLDLIGVGLIGVLSALAINGLQSRPPGDRVSQVLSIINLDNYSLQYQAAVLGILATIVLIAKTVISIFFTRRTLFFLGRRSAVMSKLLLGQIFSKDILAIQKKSSLDFLYALTTGMSAMTLGVIGTLVLLISDFSLVLVMSAGLFILDPKVAALSSGLFSCLGIVLYFILKRRAVTLGEKQASVNVKSSENITQSLISYRELLVHDQRDFMVNIIAEERMQLSDVAAEMSFLPNVSKYILEVSIVFGAVVISAYQFFTTDSLHAISVLSVFLAASTRLAPAIFRIQQGLTAIKSNLSNSQRTMDLIREHGIEPRELRSTTNRIMKYEKFAPELIISNLNFKYPNSESKTIKDISLSIPSGSFVAIVGPSGGGKSTLVDLILGVLIPDSGEIRISGENPHSAIKSWAGAISYVPQEVNLMNGTIFENITFGYDENSFSQEDIWDAISLAQLSDFVLKLPEGIQTQVGDRGSHLSGGQRQRIGLARALFSKPKLLVLDEATSALDSETEAKFTNAIQEMRGSKTIIVIAHRLATVRDADLVLYIDGGKLVAQGTFEMLKSQVPQFATQASLLGL